MSDIRIQSKGEGRWYVAYLRYLAQERESLPFANHTHYDFIPPEREAKLREDAENLVRNLFDNTRDYPAEAAYRLGEEEAVA